MKSRIYRLILLFWLILISFRAYNQNNYQLTSSSTTFTPLTGGIVPTFNYDITSAINIGFTFRYNAINYTQIKASIHGFLTFNTAANSSWTNDLTNSSSRPLLAPFWDLLDASSSGTKSYLLQGTAPNRVFTFEWLNCKTASWLDPFSFQIKLYETSNRIEFIYNRSATNFGYLSASIGMAFESTGSGNFVSLNNASTSPTISSTSETKNISTVPAAGQVYRFTYIVKPEPTNHASNFTTSTDNSNLILNWTEATGTQLPDGYLIMASTSNSFTTPTDGVAVPSDNDLSDGTGAITVLYGSQSYSSWISFIGMTNYYFRIYPFTNTGLYINYKTSGTIPSCQIVSPLFSKQNQFTLSNDSGYNSSWGDFDKDGYLDLFLGNQVLKNNAGTGFTAITGLGASGYDGQVHGMLIKWGDYNNDQNLDLCFITKDNLRYWWGYSSAIFKNKGNNTFSRNTFYFPGLSDASPAWADFNNDGHLDCILAGNQNSGNYEYKEAISRIYFNLSDTSFIESGISLRGGQSVSVMDYNNDGYSDILISGQDINTIKHTTLYKNSGGNKFIEQNSSNLPVLYESATAWGDFNNDGYTDILLSGKDLNGNAISKIYKNDGDESFSEQSGINLPGVTNGTLDWGDYNNDGFLDLLLAGKDSNGNNIFKIYKNVAGNSFVPQIELSLTDYQKGCAEWVDYDNDKDLDFILMGYIWKNFGAAKNTKPGVPQNLRKILINQNKIKLLWDNASDAETPYQSLSYNVKVGTYGGGYNIVAPMADLSTGFNRVTERGNSGSIGLILDNLSPGNYYWSVQTIDNGYLASTFAPEQSITIPPLFSKTVTKSLNSNPPGAWGDCDNDADLDLIIGAENFFINNGADVFAANNPSNYGGVKPIACSDYNNDGNLDYISGNKICRNNGDGTFTTQNDIVIKNISGGISAWGDYDNDGDQDLLVTGMIDSSPYPSAILYRNDGNNTFSEQTDIVFKGSISASWADYNNDGYLDILIGNSIYKNNGDNTFSEQTSINIEGGNFSAWGDFDDDGDLDILITGNDDLSNPVTNIYRNDGNGIFVNLESEIRKTVDHVAWGDCNNDGYMDILLSGISGYNISRVYLNKGDNTFYEIFRFDNLRATEIGWGDYNNDNNLDFFECGIPPTDIYRPTFPEVDIWKNNVSVDNIPPNVPVNLSSRQKGFDMFLSWDKASDPNDPDGNLYYNIRIGTTPDGVDILSPMAGTTGKLKIPNMGNAQCNNYIILKNLPAGKYYWSAQSIDHAYCGSPWSPVQSFTVTKISPEFSANTVCLGESTLFTNSTLTTDPIASYIWSFGDNTTSNEAKPSHIYTTAGDFMVILTAVSVINDTVRISHNVVVKDKPVAGFTSETVCLGNPSVVMNTTVSKGLDISTWNWEFGDGSISSSQQPDPHPYLTATDYKIKLRVVASNGCTDTISHIVSVGSYPVASVTTSGPLNFCNGDSVILSVPMNSTYSYSWKLSGTSLTGATSNSYQAKKSGNYNVEIINPKGNCISTSFIPINVIVRPTPLKPVTEVANYTAGKCPGENPVRLSIQPMNGYKYQWKINGIEHQGDTLSYLEFYEKGNFVVTAESNGCSTESDMFTANFPEGPAKPVIYAEGPAYWYLACSNMDAKTYKWYCNGKLVTEATQYFYLANQKLGVYQVSVGDTKGCFTKSDPIPVPPDYTTAIDDPESFKGLNIYPNPSNGLFNLEMENQLTGKLGIRIINLEGRAISTLKDEKTTYHISKIIDLTGKPSGNYFVLINFNGKTVVRKILIQ